MQEVTFRRTILPTLIAVIILVLFNLGLYFRLSAEMVTDTVSFPYQNTFETTEMLQYPSFGGDWDIRDETLVQISTTGFDLGILIPVDLTPEQAYRYSVDMRYLGGNMGGGLIFNSQNGRNRQQSHMARFNIDDNQLWIIYGYFGDDSNFTGQGSVPLEITPDTADWQNLGVLVGENSYGITLNGNLLVDNIPLQYYGGAIGLNTSASQVAFDNLVVEAWDETPPEAIVQNTPETVTQIPTETVSITIDDTSIFFDDFAGDSGGAPSLWLPFSGSWEFVDSSFVQQQIDGFDLGAGYNQAFGDVTVTTTFRHLEGQGAGVLFNMQTPDSQWNAHMVRYVHDDNFLFWGYFDAEGNFNGQGSVAVSPPANDSHTLNVINNGTSYSLILDDELLAPDIPIMVMGDYVGLVTSQSQVAFDNFNISGNGDIPLPEPEATEETSTQSLNLNIVTGDWEFDTIIQRATETIDYIAGTGVAAETFSVSVTITLPDDLDDADAGLVFHMSGRDDITNGQMIRFGSGGSEVFWGIYDENAAFEGQGGAPLELDWSEPHRLTLNVSADTYDVLIDGETLVTDLPVRGDFGWIGLVSYRGEVTFSDFALSIGQ